MIYLSHMHDAQKAYFAQAYKTGTDLWSTQNFFEHITPLLKELAPQAFILDVGIGRGKMVPLLVDRGFRIIGIDVIEDIVSKVNEEIKNRHIEKSARVMTASVLDIPFANESFDAVIDIGLAQHLLQQDFATYAQEVSRVLKPGGYILSIQFAKETQKYLTWYPKSSDMNTFERDGVSYTFFTKEEHHGLYPDTSIISETLVPIDSLQDELVRVMILQK